MQPQYPQQAQPYYAQPQYQQYAPQQPAAAPPQQSMPAVPQFTDPTMGTGGSPLKIRELEGRVCGIKPTRFVPAEPGKFFQGKPEADGIVIDVLVLDGPVPFEYGDSRANDGTGGPPVYALDQLPAIITGVQTRNSEIVRECKAVLDATPGNVIPCRVVRGTQGNRPYLLAKLGGPLDPQPQNADAARQALAQAYAAAAMGQLPPAVPREINGGPRKQQQNGTAPQPQYQQAAYPPAQYPPAPPAGQVQYPTAPVQPPQSVAAPPQAGGQAPPPPPGWDPAMWLSLTPAQRAQFTG